MIDISHDQAEYLLRKALDCDAALERCLPGVQWASLQQHLEHCAACRENHARLLALERDLRRVLPAHWRSVAGPVGALPDRVIAANQRRILAKTRLRMGGLAGLFFLAVMIAIWLSPLTAPPPLALTPILNPAHQFRGVVAFSSSQSGNQEIYLYNATGDPNLSELHNLTQNPAHDTDPVWSPDGEWIAFLSDRTGKPEVFMLSVAGTRLEQVTDDPNVDFQGPLSWSPGGGWIALVGLRNNEANQPGVFLINPYNRSQHMIPGSGSVAGPARFSEGFEPFTYLLYYSRQFGGTLVLYDLYRGTSHALTGEDNQHNGLLTGADGAFAYLTRSKKDELVYLARPKSETTSEPIQIRRLSHSKPGRQNAYDTLGTAPKGGIRGLSYLPGSSLVAVLEDRQNSGCWQVTIRNDIPGNPTRRSIAGLCVDGGLENSQWTAEGRWLVLLAHTAADKTPALYALHIPAAGDPEHNILIQKQLVVDTVVGPLRVRPVGGARSP